MSFHEIQLDPKISYGSTGGTGYRDDLAELPTGHQFTVARSTQGRFLCRALRENVTDAQRRAAFDFFRARKGSRHGFRFRNLADYTSSPSGVSHGLDAIPITPTDQEIGVGDGSTTIFPLVKRYADAFGYEIKRITKPVAGTVRVALTGTELTPSQFSVNTTAGYVSVATAAGIGDVVTAGYEYDEPVNFRTQNQALEHSFDEWNTHTIGDLLVMGIPDPSLIAEDRPYGGGKAFGVVTGNVPITLIDGTMLTFTPQTTGVVIQLPPKADAPLGADLWVIANIGTQSIAVKDWPLTTTVGTITAGSIVKVHLADFGSGTLSWVITS